MIHLVILQPLCNCCVTGRLLSFSGDSRYVDQQHQQGHWQQQQQRLHPVTNIHADYCRTTAARKSKSSPRQNCQPSERIVSAAEQLLMLASAQTSSFAEPNGFTECRSNSRDSGLSRDSDSGLSSSSIPITSQPSNVLPDTRNCQYGKDVQSPQHPSSQSSLQAPDQLVCTVMPMTNSTHIAARQCGVAARYPNFQSSRHEAYHYLNRREMVGGKHHRMALQPSRQPEFIDFSHRDSKQYCRQRVPTAHSVRHYGNMVNPSHCNGYRQLQMPSTHQLSQYRGDDASGWRVRCTAAGVLSPNCGQAVDCIPATSDTADTAYVAESRLTDGCGRTSMFDNGIGCGGRLVTTEQQDELLYHDHHNMSLSPHQPALDSHNSSIDAARYHAVQQRYQPYDISVDIRHGSNAAPHGSSGNPFYRMNPHSLMKFRQNNELLLYDSRMSGIR